MAKTKVIADSAPRLDPSPSTVKPTGPQNRGRVIGVLRLRAAA
jgi:hypothetical protein